MAKKSTKIAFKGGSIKAMLSGKLAELSQKDKIDIHPSTHRVNKCNDNSETKDC